MKRDIDIWVNEAFYKRIMLSNECDFVCIEAFQELEPVREKTDYFEPVDMVTILFRLPIINVWGGHSYALLNSKKVALSKDKKLILV